jgi:hypothetical protein
MSAFQKLLEEEVMIVLRDDASTRRKLPVEYHSET